MLQKFKRPLILSPHADDCEIGCGGTVARFMPFKNFVCAVFCTKAVIVPQDLHPDCWIEEQQEASIILGTELHLFNYPYKMRNLPEVRQNILEEIVELKRIYNPDLVFLPSTFDIHQDHKIICEEGIRAFKKSATILGYEMPWNQIGLHQSQCFVRITEDHLKRKQAAIEVFKSQIWRSFCSPEIIEANARMAGLQIGEEFAEAFEVIKWAIK